jgi:hypothetical protein
MKLSAYAGATAISQNVFIQTKFGPYARRINYKKTAIIFTIERNYVIVNCIRLKIPRFSCNFVTEFYSVTLVIQNYLKQYDKKSIRYKKHNKFADSRYR